jgi:hypothetical protein
MTLAKSLLCIASTLALSAGAAFAGEDSTVDGSVETSPPELLSDEYLDPMESSELSARISDYYYAVPKDPDDAPGDDTPG